LGAYSEIFPGIDVLLDEIFEERKIIPVSDFEKHIETIKVSDKQLGSVIGQEWVTRNRNKMRIFLTKLGAVDLKYGEALVKPWQVQFYGSKNPDALCAPEWIGEPADQGGSGGSRARAKKR
jgi:hypothetical protein